MDRKKIEVTLQYMEHCLDQFQSVDRWDSRLEQLALERICHVVIESIIDVGNAMIDGFIMRDPGSYEDIIDILCDEQVITESESTMLKEIVRYRKMLVQAYIDVDPVALKEAMKRNLIGMIAFPRQIRRYLTEELGPVSAFLPDEETDK